MKKTIYRIERNSNNNSNHEIQLIWKNKKKEIIEIENEEISPLIIIKHNEDNRSKIIINKNNLNVYLKNKKKEEKKIKGDNIDIKNSSVQCLFYYCDSKFALNHLNNQGFHKKIQMVYFDPPYGIGYDGKIVLNNKIKKGYSDKWKNGLSSYFDYLQTQLVLLRELLKPEGSIFVQIGETNLHYIRAIIDEIFGSENFVSLITFRTAVSTNRISNIADYIIWYAKDKKKMFRRNLFVPRDIKNIKNTFTYSETININNLKKREKKIIRRIGVEDINQNKNSDEKNYEMMQYELNKGQENIKRFFKPQEIIMRITPKKNRNNRKFDVIFNNKKFYPPEGFEWKWEKEQIYNLIKNNRITEINGKLYGKRYLEDFPEMLLTNLWTDTTMSTFAARKHYTVHTNPKVIWRCMAMTTKPGDWVLDPTGGSGTTGYIAEKYLRNWILIDNNPIAFSGSISWIYSSNYPFLKINEITGDFEYEYFEKKSLSLIAKDMEISKTYFYDRPVLIKKKNNEKRKARPIKVFTLQNIIDSLNKTKKKYDLSEIMKSNKSSINLPDLDVWGIFINYNKKYKKTNLLDFKDFYCCPVSIAFNIPYFKNLLKRNDSLQFCNKLEIKSIRNLFNEYKTHPKIENPSNSKKKNHKDKNFEKEILLIGWTLDGYWFESLFY